jgi:hypothetical protein
MALTYTVMCALLGCSKSGNTQSDRNAGDTLVLNIRNNTADDNWTDTCNGGYWNHTYDDQINSIRFGEFVFSHLPAGPGAAFGPNACPGAYWDGFTVSSNGDSANYGQGGSSQGWIAHQWGVMAGGGIDTIINGVPSVVKGVPYLLAYWGYHMEPEWWFMHSGNIPPEPMHCLTAVLADSSLFKPLEVWICNHPWPYYGNIYGDGFATPFEPGDYFNLIIHAIKAGGREDSIVHPLAVYGRVLDQSPDWKKVDLTNLFLSDNDSIQSLYFTMKTTDEDPQWGPNTAVYFCLDKLKVVKQEETASSGESVAKARVAKPGAKGLMEVRDYFPVASYTGGEVLVYDANGNEVLKTTVKAGEKPNLSKLPEGEYRLRHGHRHIPFKKVK